MTTIDIDNLSAYTQQELEGASRKIFEELGPSQAWAVLEHAAEAIKREGGGMVVASRFDPDNPFQVETLGCQSDFSSFEDFRTTNIILAVRAWLMLEQLYLHGANQVGIGPVGARELFAAAMRKMMEDQAQEPTEPPSDDEPLGPIPFDQK